MFGPKRSGYWQHVSPAGAIGDLWSVFKNADHNRWRIAVLAAIVTTAIFSVMWNQGGKGPPKPHEITYIRTFAAGRSDAEIAASNRANMELQKRLNAEQAKRDEDVRQIYKNIGRASGMDVDAIERQARADRAAEARAKQEALRRVAAGHAAPPGGAPSSAP